MQTLEWHQRRMLEALFEANTRWAAAAPADQRAVWRAAAVGALWAALQAWVERRLAVSPEALLRRLLLSPAP